MNLVLVDACKSVREAREFFSLLEKLYVFTSGSLMHIRWLEVQRRLNPSEPPRQLQRLCDTRWACRATACRNIRDRLPAIHELLTEIANDADSDRAIEARGILLQLDFTFVLLLNFFSEILNTANAVSTQPQAKDADLVAALDLLQCLTDNLTKCRDDSSSEADKFL